MAYASRRGDANAYCVCLKAAPFDFALFKSPQIGDNIFGK